MFPPDGSLVLTESATGVTKVWCSTSGLCLRTFTDCYQVAYAQCPSVFSHDGSKFHFVILGNDLNIWTIQTGRVVNISGHNAAVKTAIFSRNGNFILTTSVDTTARFFCEKTGVLQKMLHGHVNHLCTAIFSPSGLLVITGAEDGIAKVWCTSTGACVRTLYGHRRGCLLTSAFFSPTTGS